MPTEEEIAAEYAQLQADLEAFNAPTDVEILQSLQGTANELATANNLVNQLADNQVVTAKIDDGAVTGDKLATGSVDNSKLANSTIIINGSPVSLGGTASQTPADGTINSGKLSTDAVITSKIQDSAVTTDKIADDAITRDKIGTGEVLTGNIATDAVTSAKIGTSEVETDNIAPSAVVASKIANATIVGGKVASHTLTYAKLQEVTNNLRALGAITAGDVVEIPIDTDVQPATTDTSLATAKAIKAYVEKNRVNYAQQLLKNKSTLSLTANTYTTIPSLEVSIAPKFTGSHFKISFDAYIDTSNNLINTDDYIYAKLQHSIRTLSTLSLDGDFSETTSGTYTSNPSDGEWNVFKTGDSADNKVVIGGGQAQILNTDGQVELSTKQSDLLTVGDKYEFEYTITAHSGGRLGIYGTNPSEGHETDTFLGQQIIYLKTEVGTHKTTFNATSGSHVILAAEGNGNRTIADVIIRDISDTAYQDLAVGVADNSEPEALILNLGQDRNNTRHIGISEFYVSDPTYNLGDEVAIRVQLASNLTETVTINGNSSATNSPVCLSKISIEEIYR